MTKSKNKPILTEQEAQVQAEDIASRYEKLADFVGKPPRYPGYSALVVLVHALLTGPKAPHSRLLTSLDKQHYLEDVMRLDRRDAVTLMGLYEDAVTKYPEDFPHLQHLLESARKRLTDAEEEQWLHSSLVSAKVH